MLAKSPHKIEHNYLTTQFADAVEVWLKIQRVVERADFTLGKELRQFEDNWAEYVGTQHAVGVNSGTDALILIMKAFGIRGEVVVPAFGFVASPAAIHMAGAKIRFVDVAEDFNIDIVKLEAAISPATEAIMVVHWAGRPCFMGDVMNIARRHSLLVIEDACHAIGAEFKGVKCGNLGNAAAFSLHPLKNVNVWGDGGVVTTQNSEMHSRLLRLRNHGLSDRNTCDHWGHNSRLDTIQAVVGSHVLNKLEYVISRRQDNARVLDKLLRPISGVRCPPVVSTERMTYYLYSIRAHRRNELAAYLNAKGVDAKIHYPVPLHLQPAAAKLGHKRGDFPGAEKACDETLSLPVHEFVTLEDLEYMAELIGAFYA